MVHYFLTGLLMLFSINICRAGSGRPSIATDKERLADIDAELDQLAAFTLRSGIGSVGYRSQLHETPEELEWVHIELGEDVLIDQAVLVPMLFLVPETGFCAEGFPQAFRILAGTGQTTNVVAEITTEDHVMPRIAPLAVSFPPVKASWITIEATVLSPRLWDERYVFQLSEIMVFSGNDNVALNKPVTSPLSYPNHVTGPFHNQHLVDGFTPYLMDAAQKENSKTQLINIDDTTTPPTLTIELDTSYPINQINLHTANLEYSIPMSQSSNRAVPRHIRIWGANQADFSDAVVLCEHQQKTIYDNGPIIILRVPETRCAFVKIEILDYRPVGSATYKQKSIAFAEIEVISNGQNVALHAPVKASSNLATSSRTMSRITDGLSYYGEILPIRVWMNQLSRRHDLENARPEIALELNQLYAAQKVKLRTTQGTVLFLIIAIVFTILIDHIIRLRQAARIRERFAADLHDELGATNYTIGLFSDALCRENCTPEKRKMLYGRIRTIVDQNGRAIRNISNLLDADIYQGLVQDIERIAERVSGKLEHSLTIEGEELLNHLPPRTRADLFLFFKESLVNVCRHSTATAIRTHIAATPKQLTLTVSDNGQGLPDNKIPPSLKRRAKLFKAKISIDESADGGAQITLILRIRRRFELSSITNRMQNRKRP
jgi:signal transduction histidine kinase